MRATRPLLGLLALLAFCEAAPAGAVTYDTFDSDSVAIGTVVLTNGNLTAQGASGMGLNSAGIAQATEGKTSGKWCVTFTLVAVSGNSDAVGISNSWGISTNAGTGRLGVLPTFATGNYSWGYFNSAGNILTGGGSAPSNVNNVSYTAGDTIDVAIDLDNSRLWFRKNSLGNWVGLSGTPNPATNTQGFDISRAQAGGARVFPAVSLSGSSAKFTANFGASACSGGGLPSGFTAGWTNTTAGTYFGSLMTQGKDGGNTGQTQAAQGPWVTKHVASLTGALSSVVMGNFTAITGTVIGTVYAANGAGGGPGTLLAFSTNTLTNPPAGEVTFNYSGFNITSGTTYWIGLSASADGLYFTTSTLTSGSATGTTAYATNPKPSAFGTITSLNVVTGMLVYVTAANSNKLFFKTFP